MLIALVLRFDLMMSYGSITGPVLSCASLFCMLLYFVTTVDSGRWVLSNSKVSLSDDVIFFKSHTWQPGFRLPCKQWPNIHLAPSASSLVCNCWGVDYISIVFPIFIFANWFDLSRRWWQAHSCSQAAQQDSLLSSLSQLPWVFFVVFCRWHFEMQRCDLRSAGNCGLLLPSPGARINRNSRLARTSLSHSSHPGSVAQPTLLTT